MNSLPLCFPPSSSAAACHSIRIRKNKSHDKKSDGPEGGEGEGMKGSVICVRVPDNRGVANPEQAAGAVIPGSAVEESGGCPGLRALWKGKVLKHAGVICGKVNTIDCIILKAKG